MWTRVEWESKERDHERVSVIAELNNKGRWEFWEKCQGEYQWFRIETTVKLVKKATRLLASRIFHQTFYPEPDKRVYVSSNRALIENGKKRFAATFRHGGPHG